MSSKKEKKSKKDDGLTIAMHEQAKDEWLKRVGGGRKVVNLSDLIGRHPFRNNLPEPPMDPKFLKASTEALTKQIPYKPTSIESRYKYPILTEPNLGVTVNLIDPNAYHFYRENEEAPVLSEMDAFLANLKVDPPGKKKTAKRPQARVAWLRKTEYMANDLYEPTQKFKSQLDTMNTQRSAAKRNHISSRTVEERISEIESSFDLAKEPPVHPTDKNLKPVKILEVLPNMEMWANSYTGIGFDDNAHSFTGHTKEEASKAIIKAFSQVLEDGMEPEQFVGYMLPKKRKIEEDALEEPEEEEEPSEYDWIRNYSFQKEGEEDEQNLILIESGDSVSFVTIRTKLAVHRIAQIKELAANQYKPSRVDIERRPFRTHERNARGRRKRVGLALPYDSESDSEPEPEAMIEDEPDELEKEGDETEVKKERDADISGDEAAPANEEAEPEAEEAAGEGEVKEEPAAAPSVPKTDFASDDDDDL